MNEFKLLMNAIQFITFEELPVGLQHEITSSVDSNEIENGVLLFKVRRLNVGGYLHTIAYIETDANYYVYTYVVLKAGTSIKKQTISKTTISMFELLHNEDRGGNVLCSKS
ncbi:TPA: hypothetical protein ACTZ5S_001790 [Bacillus cereus]|uniref:hypothetical protein n=1 Tax=Bacillus TaxID=1386 RepID=UPI00088FEFB6|nr:MULTISPECIES: hypothetical protein [Bacillus]ASK14478.1 hypothetical protein BA201_11445 [Bacillus cereus]MBL3782070.1 hypothetical protein [Bacillus cereus]MBL3800614.1 hypothetical protein [Bacillus cereus]MBL3813391.1 hypothetical protein [Bacillus cereus]MCU5251870.1 hypothetical protein [Bacillus cereus]